VVAEVVVLLLQMMAQVAVLVKRTLVELLGQTMLAVAQELAELQLHLEQVAEAVAECSNLEIIQVQVALAHQV